MGLLTGVLRQLAAALMADSDNGVDALGWPVMLAEAIVFDRCLGSMPAAAVIERLGGWQGDPQVSSA